jgi:hypothetical protein
VSDDEERKGSTDDEKSRQLLDDPDGGDHRRFKRLKRRLRLDCVRKCLARKGAEEFRWFLSFVRSCPLPSSEWSKGPGPRVQIIGGTGEDEE